jgi:undecaprenyl-diphosphatase
MNLDRLCVDWIQAHQITWVFDVMKALSAVTSSKVCCLAAAIVAVHLMFQRRFMRGTIIFFGTALSALLAELLKWVFHRARPPFSGLDESYSFPSGHVLTSTVFFGLLAWSLSKDFPPQRKSFVGIAAASIVAVGCSRLYLGVHWLTDVIGGLVIGLLFMKGWLRLTAGNR